MPSLNQPLLLSLIIFAFCILLPRFSITAANLKKCKSLSDCDVSSHEICLNQQCIQRNLRAQCRDNDDCNVASGSAGGEQDAVQWLICMKDPDDAFGHCQPASVRYVDQDADQDELDAADSVTGEMNAAGRNRTIWHRIHHTLMNATRDGNLQYDLSLINSTHVKHHLIQHMRNISSLHDSMCKLMNYTQTQPPPTSTPKLSDGFLHYFHELVFGDQDVKILNESSAKSSSQRYRVCGTTNEAKNIEKVQERANVNVSHDEASDRYASFGSQINPSPSTTDPLLLEASLASTSDYPIPLCGYGICDNPNYRKRYYSMQLIRERAHTRIVFLHFHVMPTVMYADDRIAASVRRLNEFYSPGGILFLAFVSNYEGRYRNCRLAREQEIAECIRSIGALNCALDEDVVEDIYGPDWRKRGSFHVLVGNLFQPTLLGWSHFPWVDLHGLVTIADAELDVRSTTLAHELGHAAGGLHHVFRGREEVSKSSEVTQTSKCTSCVEQEPSDWTGDMCQDTMPTPENFFCRNPTIREHADVCSPSRLTWLNTPYTNLMGYTPSSCNTHFTNDQFERMHCWISHYRNAFHMLSEQEEEQLRTLQIQECFTKWDGTDYRGSFDDFGACKPWPSTWWSAEWGILPGDNACRNPNPSVNPSLWCFYGENGKNPTLCSESGTALFFNRTCDASPNRYDSRYQTLMEEIRECYEDPMAQTTEVLTLRSTAKTEPQNGISTEHNYCRNPRPNAQESNSPWCFTEPGGKKPRYCRQELAKNHRRECPRIPPQAEMKQECYTEENFSDYRGRFNNHGKCDFWPTEDPVNGVSMSHNFCRNPDGAPWFWCYEDSYRGTAIYCDTNEIERFHRADCGKL
eukprot:CAMPEP_0117454186 /NCGR_PEP_ID=MMETSP0759-20121206/10665_1 /TAXON_ID=63605 /ORGANISM="Percolomonas cosmopolitus, Strain WS" /LENGTH=858 /DNA_ID=CAMNT_0005247353 /DNA_START=1184 /DNA_END=3761 /DNA_ORIENTATION=+